MKIRIFTKMLLSYFLIILLLTFFIIKFSFDSINKHNLKTLTIQMEKISRSVAVIIKPFVEENLLDDLGLIVGDTSKKIKTRITIMTPDGYVIADSEKDPKTMENHSNRPEFMQALQHRTGSSLRYSSSLKKRMLYVATPVFEKDNIICLVRVSNFYEQIESFLTNLESDILKIGIIIGLLSLLLAYFFSRHITFPIRQLAQASRRIANGDYNVEIRTRNKDEIKDLADNFNTMAFRVNDLVTALTKRKEELNRIITSIKEILWVIDKDSKIVISNDNFNTFIGLNPYGKNCWEVIKDPDILDFVNSAIKGKQEDVKEIIQKNNYYILSNTFIETSGEIIFSMVDITEIKRVEKMKKDFVSNVSHELRTPLTSIKGYTETLEEELGEESSPYLKVIKRNTNRLIKIVQDILTLSDLEQQKKLDVEVFDFKELVENVATLVKPLADKKSLELRLNLEAFNYFMGDRFKLEQVLINLTENAVKYTEKGFVEINLKTDNKNVFVEINDSGIGIKESKIPRLFERFYVVDKSRSRRVGGTGLGLSIVKHIINLHGGSIKVTSEVGKGSSFQIKLPIENEIEI